VKVEERNKSEGGQKKADKTNWNGKDNQQKKNGLGE
jgi:hypothetical protein